MFTTHIEKSGKSPATANSFFVRGLSKPPRNKKRGRAGVHQHRPNKNIGGKWALNNQGKAKSVTGWGDQRAQTTQRGRRPGQKCSYGAGGTAQRKSSTIGEGGDNQQTTRNRARGVGSTQKGFSQKGFSPDFSKMDFCHQSGRHWPDLDDTSGFASCVLGPHFGPILGPRGAQKRPEKSPKLFGKSIKI